MERFILDILACPVCGSALSESSDGLLCERCGKRYGVSGQIPVLLAGNTDAAFDYVTHYTVDSEKFDYFEERHGATAHSERRLREYILSLIPKNATMILDAGCGSAWVAKEFQDSGKTVISLDISVVNPAKAIERYPFATHAGVVGDSYHLPFKEGSFDVVLAAEIIEHLHDPQAFADELLRVLKPGGTAIISTPYREQLVYEVCIHCHQETPHNAHLHSWTDESLTALFRNKARTTLHTFNNKLLLFARTYPVLQYLPFALWKSLDRLANRAIRKPVNCILEVTK